MVISCELPVSHQDADLERRVVNFLLGYKIPALRGIEVRSDRGEVTLQGRVSSFYQRQLCISCCRHVAGVIDVVDRIQVA
jgi:osmotically-inducible protein OsmY